MVFSHQNKGGIKEKKTNKHIKGAETKKNNTYVYMWKYLEERGLSKAVTRASVDI